MSPSPSSNDNNRKTSSPDDGSLAAWCLIGGAFLGAAIGHFAFARAILLGAITGAVIGWLVGVVIDRAIR